MTYSAYRPRSGAPSNTATQVEAPTSNLAIAMLNTLKEAGVRVLLHHRNLFVSLIRPESRGRPQQLAEPRPALSRIPQVTDPSDAVSV